MTKLKNRNEWQGVTAAVNKANSGELNHLEIKKCSDVTVEVRKHVVVHQQSMGTIG